MTEQQQPVVYLVKELRPQIYQYQNHVGGLGLACFMIGQYMPYLLGDHHDPDGQLIVGVIACLVGMMIGAIINWRINRKEKRRIKKRNQKIRLKVKAVMPYDPDKHVLIK